MLRAFIALSQSPVAIIPNALPIDLTTKKFFPVAEFIFGVA